MNTVLLDPAQLCPEQHPVLYVLAGAFYEFKRSFNLINDNFTNSKILGNPNIVYDKRYRQPVGDNFWYEKLQNPHGNLKEILVSDIITPQGRLKNIEELNVIFMNNFERQTYNEIRKVIETSLYVINRDKIETPHPNLTMLESFITNFKKG
jgi:hypothetical protein